LKLKKTELLAQIAANVQAALKATATDIRTRVSTLKDQLSARITDLALDLESNIQGINVTAVELTPSGVKYVLSIQFENVATRAEYIQQIVQTIYQQVFSTPNVVVTVSLSQKRGLQTVTMESNVASSDGSSVSSSSAGIPLGATIGIAVAVVVVIIIVVVLIVVFYKKKQEDDYKSMRA